MEGNQVDIVWRKGMCSWIKDESVMSFVDRCCVCSLMWINWSRMVRQCADAITVSEIINGYATNADVAGERREGVETVSCSIMSREMRRVAPRTDEVSPVCTRGTHSVGTGGPHPHVRTEPSLRQPVISMQRCQFKLCRIDCRSKVIGMRPMSCRVG